MRKPPYIEGQVDLPFKRKLKYVKEDKDSNLLPNLKNEMQYMDKAMFEIPLCLNKMKATRAMQACQQSATYENFETINSNKVD